MKIACESVAATSKNWLTFAGPLAEPQCLQCSVL